METINQQASTTDIPGLLIFSLNLHEDERGWFQEKFQKQKLVAAGLPESFNPVQHSLSYNKTAGVTRGLHAEPWNKYVGVITGKVFAAYVDLRKGQTFGKTVCVTIDSTTAVYVPKGVANSFQSLEPDTYYSYLVDDFWDENRKSEYKSLNPADPDLAIPWPITLSEAIISDKDKAQPYFKDVEPF